MTGREHGKARHLGQDLPGQRVKQMQAFHHVVEQLDPDRGFRVFRRKNIDDIAAHAEHATLEFNVVAVVLHLRQPRDDLALLHLLVLAQQQDHAVIVGWIADTVDRRHGANDDRVAPLQQRFGRTQAHLLDVLVDAGVFLDEQIARRHVGFGLVVIVVGDEILDRVFRKELTHLRIQLCRQGFVGRHHQRRPPSLRNHVGHGEGLARSGYPQQGLIGQPILDALDEFGNGGRLIASRLKWLEQTERAIGEGDEHR